MSDGFNPMRWACERDGCFNVKRRPKIETFADCFPRRVNFGDVDGLVELNGRFCLLEWKGDGGSVKTGQHLSYCQFSGFRGNIVFVVNGDAETMKVSSYQLYWGGTKHPEVKADLGGLKQRLRRWAAWTEQKAAA